MKLNETILRPVTVREDGSMFNPWMIAPFFARCNLWIGAYWDRERKMLYVLPVPMLGFVIGFPHEQKTHAFTREGLVDMSDLGKPDR